MVKITETVKYIGVDDRAIDFFESQYAVPEGISYNSYLILDEKVALMDTVDKRLVDEWEKKLLEELGGRKVDYLVIHHLEPDHAGSIARLVELFPDIMLVGNARTFAMIPQFFDFGLEEQTLLVKEGDMLSLGEHELTFLMAPMVHWPEVMVTYESKDKLFFSADAFGKFGALGLDKGKNCTNDERCVSVVNYIQDENSVEAEAIDESGIRGADWTAEARRYYFNIVGKYGTQVQALLKKVATIDIAYICPLHGPVLSKNLAYYIGLYDTWSSYRPESQGVLIVSGSIYGNTTKVAEKIAQMLREKGVEVVLKDLARTDMSEAVADAFRYDRMIVAAASYDGGVFPCVQDFLLHLKGKAYQNRKVALVQNGSWGPCAALAMKPILESMKNVELVDDVVTIRSTLKDSDLPGLEKLVDSMIGQ